MMKSVAAWRALSCAGMMMAVWSVAGQAVARPVERPVVKRLIEPISMATPPAASPLRFFTIAERVAALRAAGQLPAPARPAVASEPVAATRIIEATTMLPPQASLPSVLGMAILPLPGGEFSAKWSEMNARWQGEQEALDACRIEVCVHRGAARWFEISTAAGKLTGLDQVAFVHASVNRSISYATDFASRGVADYWASPLESLGGLGDCEDYVIAKYMMLRSLGYGARDLKLVVLYQPWAGMHHAVLAVRSGESWVYLDNQRAKLSSEADYRNANALAVVDEAGEALLAPLPRMAALAPEAGVETLP